jgi:transposase
VAIVAPSPLPEQAEVVLGVDTDKEIRVAAVLTVLGVCLAGRKFPATAAGYRGMVAWARSFGALRRAGVEGTGSYGAALARTLRAEAVTVVEVNRSDRSARRRRGKKDAVDAEAAAHAVLSGDATATPKTGDGPVEALRVLKIAKDSAGKARVQAINQLKAVLVNAAPVLREDLTPQSTRRLIARCADLAFPADAEGHPAPPANAAAATLHTLRHLARRIQYLDAEIDDLRQRITAAPRLLEVYGIGPDAAHCRRRQPRPARHRGILRRPLRGQPGRGVIGQDPTPSPQPRRAPPCQRRPLPGRAHLPTLEPPNPRLPSAADHRRAVQTRDHPLPQTLPRPHGLPDHPTGNPDRTTLSRLTSIGASSTCS